MNCKEFVKSESLVIIFEICRNTAFFYVRFVKLYCLSNKKAGTAQYSMHSTA